MRRLTWLDVFTSTPLTGNGLAVVHDADGLDEAAMLAFARETRLSETTFVQSAAADGADYRNRIWTTREELPFAGHPSLGTAVAVVRARGDRSATVVQQTGAGLQPIDVEVDGDRARASMLQEPLSYPAPPSPVDDEEVAALFGLTPDDLDPAIPVALASTGLVQLLVPVRDAAVLDRLRVPGDDVLLELLDRHGATVYYAAAVDGERAVARSFFSGGEDPATGSAAGPLCAHVHATNGTRRLAIAQGAAIGRPSTLLTEMAGDRVRVTGDAVVVMDGRVALDT